jgi:hypothetical protein
MDAQTLAANRTAKSRAIAAQKIITRLETQDSSREISGEYAGYNATTGDELIQLNNGGIIPSKSVSNGFAKPGDRISAVAPLGSSKAISDRMPR